MGRRLPEEPQDRICEFCSKPFGRNKIGISGSTEALSHFLKRRFCGKPCANAFMRGDMGKHSELNVTRKFQQQARPLVSSIKPPNSREYTGEYVPPVFNEEKYEQECDFRYSRAFIAYKLVLETILRKADRPLNTGDIKRVMGEQFRPEWHQDAIEMSKHILVFWGYPDHYCWYAGEITEERKVEWNGRIAPPSKPVADLGLEGRILA